MHHTTWASTRLQMHTMVSKAKAKNPSKRIPHVTTKLVRTKLMGGSIRAINKERDKEGEGEKKEELWQLLPFSSIFFWGGLTWLPICNTALPFFS